MEIIQKLNGILSTLGYADGEIKDLQVSDDGSTCNISFKITNVKCEVKKEQDPFEDDTDDLKDVHLPWSRPNIVPTRSNYISKVTPVKVEEPKKKVTFEEFCKQGAKEVTYDPVKEEIVEKDNKPKKTIFDDSQESNGWKTPTPRVILRRVFFKSYELAKKFAEEYERDFEKNDYMLKKETYYKPYNIVKNTVDDKLFKKGYGYFLEFRMNGKTFKLLEATEDLKKLEGRKHGGACMRYKV